MVDLPFYQTVIRWENDQISRNQTRLSLDLRVSMSEGFLFFYLLCYETSLAHYVITALFTNVVVLLRAVYLTNVSFLLFSNWCDSSFSYIYTS